MYEVHMQEQSMKLLQQHRRPFQVTELPRSSFSIYVPSTLGVSTSLDVAQRDRVVTGMARMLAELAGGCTATEGSGFYLSHSGRIVQEDVTILQSHMDLSQEEVREELLSMAHFLCIMLQQESVLVNLGGSPMLIAPRPKLNSLLQLWNQHQLEPRSTF